MVDRELPSHPLAPKFAQRNPFERPYRFSSDRSGPSVEADGVNYASSLGKICETVALKVLTEPPDIPPPTKKVLIDNFEIVSSFLRGGFSATKKEEGKTTLSHARIVPVYLDAIQDKKTRAALCGLVKSTEAIFPDTNLSTELLQHIDDFDHPRISSFIPLKIRYLIDTILTVSRLAIDRENLRTLFIGKLLPDVGLGYSMTGTQALQFDGIFFPQDTSFPDFKNGVDKEKYLFTLAEEPPDRYQPTVPAILDHCIPLEIKTVYRARSVAARPAISGIRGFQLEEFLDRLGRSCTEAKLAIAPRAVVFLYLGGVQPSAVFYKRLDSSFYRFWAGYIEHFFLYDLPEISFRPLDMEDQLGSLLDFTTLMADKLEKEERETAKAKAILPPVSGKTKRLAGFANIKPSSSAPIVDMPTPVELRKKVKRPRSKDTQDKLLTSFGSLRQDSEPK